MVYEGTQTLQYVKNYVNGADQWGGYGFPVKCRAPKNTILLGAKGSSSSSAIATLASEAIKNDYLGIMVWYASVKNGFDYAPGWDASTANDAINGYVAAMKRFREYNDNNSGGLEVSPVVAEPDLPDAPGPAVAPTTSAPAPVTTPSTTTAAPTTASTTIRPSQSGHPAWPNKVATKSE